MDVSINQFIAVIVLYKINLSESTTFKSLTESLQVNNLRIDLIVYDNSPEFNHSNTFDSFVNWKIIYCADSENSGVSKAYNEGAKIGRKLGKKWILLLDQDTDFPLNTIFEYLSSVKQYLGEKLFTPIMMVNKEKIISPSCFKFMRGFSIKHIDFGLNSFNNRSIINSGMCIDIDAFYKNNGYNELIKLDFSDHDFIKRFKNIVTNSFVVINLVVNHQLSSEKKNSLNSDLVRFDYYLKGMNHIKANFFESAFLTNNAFLRAVKLSIQHQNVIFIKKVMRVHN